MMVADRSKVNEFYKDMLSKRVCVWLNNHKVVIGVLEGFDDEGVIVMADRGRTLINRASIEGVSLWVKFAKEEPGQDRKSV